MSLVFSEIEDPPVERTPVHLLKDILIIGILSVIAVTKVWEDMQNYGLSKYDWLEHFLPLPEDIPTADTFRRVFEPINPKVFERCFRGWVESIVEAAGAQVISIDAMGTQTAIAFQIFNAKADYVLALKGNHPTLYGQVKNWFEQQLYQGFKGIIHSSDKRVEKGHHRTEKRQIWCVPISQLQTLHNQDNWVGLKWVVMVVRLPHIWNKTTREVQFYLTSLNCAPRNLGPVIRLHWGVKNGLHWTLDVTFSEDACGVRTGHAPQNLALFRRIAINALNLEQSLKRSNRQKPNGAAIDNHYMLTVLTACLSQHYDETSEAACQ
ncbi:Transposase, IS4 [Richelia intracellularis]|nr:Transposase, IS4 [Richelia intracellularis]